MADPSTMTTEAAAESRIAGFIAKYTPEIAADLIASRAKIRAAFPRGYELVYDNYNALVFGFSATGRTSDAFLSIAAYPRWITLFFLDGVTLDDPLRLLVGTGTQVRSIRLESPSQLDEPNVRHLILCARRPWIEALEAAPPLTTIIKTVSARQRPRRPPPPPAKGARS